MSCPVRGAGARSEALGDAPATLTLQYVPVVRQLKAYLNRCGLPEEILFPPPYLAAHHNELADKELWDGLFGAQHDEKDIYRTTGPTGIQDWGDGEAQQVLQELSSSVQAMDTALKSLRLLPPSLTTPATEYALAMRVMKVERALLLEYLERTSKRVATIESRTSKLRSRQAKLPAGSTAQHAGG